jgi:hypothetical protein
VETCDGATLVDVGREWTAIGLLPLVFYAVEACSDSGEPSGGANAGTASCAAQTDKLISDCGTDPADRDFWIEDCESQRRDYAPMGCLPAFDAWLACTTTDDYDCNTDSGCERMQQGYFACQSQFVSRTGCTRLGSRDDELCGGQTPHAFACLSAAPASCVPASAGGMMFCCPPLA